MNARAARGLQRLSLGSRITALSSGVAVLLVLIAAVATLTATTNRGDTDRLTTRISPALVYAERLGGVALTQSSAIIQYAAAGDAQRLDEYRRAVADERSLAAKIEPLVRGERGLVDRLRSIRTRLDSWRGAYADPLIVAVRATGPDPQRANLSSDATARFDAIMAEIADLQARLTALRDRLRDEVLAASDMILWLLVSAALVVLAGGLMLWLLLSRLVTRPVTALAGEVRRVAAGDYDHEIRPTGPPEVRRLARDVNGMRKQIAADLSVVRQARLEIEEANQQLEQQAQELTRSNRDLEQFAYVASHDLQEPLRKVASFCQLLQRRYAGQLDERADQYIYFAVDGAQRMQRLINDLLAFSRIGRFTGGFVDVDLDKVVDEVISQRGAAVTRDDLPTVRGEEPLLTALLSNLVGNSMKFKRPDTPARVHVGVVRHDDEWELYVRDNGIGIAPEFVDKIFVIFQRLHGRDAYPGTGIGLAIAKKIVEYHGGRIWVDTDYVDGTLIRFTLPAPVDAVPAGSALVEERES